MNQSFALNTRDLSKRYGQHLALDNLSLAVPRGSVFAFLGQNGAGKTTTIRILLDLLDRTSGEADILGLDCVKDSLAIRRRVGYVGENQRMHDWMSVDEMIWFCKGFYPGWDDTFASGLKKKLGLPGDRKVGELSKGMQAKLALLLAMAYHPELLILDEPTSGLDVVVRRDFMEGILEMFHGEGKTVFFSSHIVHEVERIADWIGIVDGGRLVWCSTIDDLKASVKRMILTFDTPPASLSAIPGTLCIETIGRQTAVTVRDFSDATLSAARSLSPEDIRVDGLGLEDIFVALVSKPEVQ